MKIRTITTSALFQISDFGEGGVLAAGSEEVAQRFERDASIAAFVE